jgi:hypothetical protein
MVRPLVSFRSVLPAALALMSCLGAGCASSQAARREEALQAARDERHSHVQQATYSDDDSSQMSVSGEEGTLNAADVESALHDHFGEIRDCFHLGHRGGPQRATGRLMLRFFVDGKGEVSDVQVVESTIGNHVVERCIADIGLGVVFERPAGHKATTFDYPVELRPARQVTADRQRRP